MYEPTPSNVSNNTIQFNLPNDYTVIIPCIVHASFACISANITLSARYIRWSWQVSAFRAHVLSRAAHVAYEFAKLSASVDVTRVHGGTSVRPSGDPHELTAYFLQSAYPFARCKLSTFQQRSVLRVQWSDNHRKLFSIVPVRLYRLVFPPSLERETRVA